MKRRSPGSATAELIIGIIFVILGILTFFSPQTTLSWVVVIYGIIAIATGIGDIVFYVRSTQFTGFGPMLTLIMGILGVMAGFMLVLYPSAGTWLMVLIIPIWFIAHCISRLAQLSGTGRVNGKFYYYLTMILNIIGIILGIIMIFRPMLTYLTAGIIIGLYLVIMGADWIVDAVKRMRY